MGNSVFFDLCRAPMGSGCLAEHSDSHKGCPYIVCNLTKGEILNEFIGK